MNDMTAEKGIFRLCRDILGCQLGHLDHVPSVWCSICPVQELVHGSPMSRADRLECQLHGVASDKSPETTIEGQVLGDSLTTNSDHSKVYLKQGV